MTGHFDQVVQSPTWALQGSNTELTDQSDAEKVSALSFSAGRRPEAPRWSTCEALEDAQKHLQCVLVI